MTIAEAIREYVNETEGLELYEQDPGKRGQFLYGDDHEPDQIFRRSQCG